MGFESESGKCRLEEKEKKNETSNFWTVTLLCHGKCESERGN